MYYILSWCYQIVEGKHQEEDAMGRTETKNQIPQLRAWGRRGLTNHVSKLNKCTD